MRVKKRQNVVMLERILRALKHSKDSLLSCKGWASEATSVSYRIMIWNVTIRSNLNSDLFLHTANNVCWLFTYSTFAYEYDTQKLQHCGREIIRFEFSLFWQTYTPHTKSEREMKYNRTLNVGGELYHQYTHNTLQIRWKSFFLTWRKKVRFLLIGNNCFPYFPTCLTGGRRVNNKHID